MTKGGGGSKCYENDSVGNVYPDPSCVRLKPGYNPPILNPYYGMSPQPLLDRNGWYPVGLDYAYLSPNVASLVVNYKRAKFTITPALTFNEGQPYGNPADVYGYDPRVCTRNSAKIPTAKNPLQADYTTCFSAATQNGTSPGSLYIPNPQTGSFDGFGSYRQPSQLNLSMTVGYQLTPAIKANLLMANLVNACFGGSSEPWSKQYPPNGYTCGYIPNFYYVSNFYNGYVAERSRRQRHEAQPRVHAIVHSRIRRHELVRSAQSVQHVPHVQHQDLSRTAAHTDETSPCTSSEVLCHAERLRARFDFARFACCAQGDSVTDDTLNCGALGIDEHRFVTVNRGRGSDVAGRTGGKLVNRVVRIVGDEHVTGGIEGDAAGAGEAGGGSAELPTPERRYRWYRCNTR